MKTNYELRYAAHPKDAKNYDTARLREDFLIQNLFVDNEVNMVLEAIDPLKATHFLSRREIGIFNVGGAGRVKVDGKTFDLDFKEALYLGCGDRTVSFESVDAAKPAKFYFNSAPAHRNCPDKKVTKADAIVAEMGSLEGSNHRNINKMLVCRMEAYFYFEIPEGDAICHFMGEPTETRHIWMKGEEAVLSPEWSIHSAAATHNYTFIWGMGGENLDYGDQDFYKYTELR